MSQKEMMQRSAQSWAEAIVQSQAQQQRSQQMNELSQEIAKLKQANSDLQQRLSDSLAAQTTLQQAWLSLNQWLQQLERQNTQNPVNLNATLSDLTRRIEQMESRIKKHDRSLTQHHQQFSSLNQTYQDLQQSLSDFTQQLNNLGNEDVSEDQDFQMFKGRLEARLNPLSQSIDRLEAQMPLLQSQTTTDSSAHREAVTQLRTEMKAAFKQVSDRLKQIEEKQTKRGWLG